VPSSRFSEEGGGGGYEIKYMQLTCFALPRTTVFGLKVKRGCKIEKVAVEILDATMVKIRLLDVLDIYVGGVVDINVTCPDEVEEVFFVHFPPLLCFCFWLGRHWGGEWGRGVVVGGGCGCVVWR
jgi:hypothetical protein